MFISGLKCITKVHPRSKACACKAPLKKSLGHPSPGSWVSARPGRDMESLAGMWQLCIQVCRAPAGMRRQENQVLEARPSPESLKKRKKKTPSGTFSVCGDAKLEIQREQRMESVWDGSGQVTPLTHRDMGLDHWWLPA